MNSPKLTESNKGAGKVTDVLFHVLIIVGHPMPKPGGDHQDVYILGTCATVEAAKSLAENSLGLLGYSTEEFELYEQRSQASANWEHGDGVIVYGKTPAGDEVRVAIDTKPNTESLQTSSDGILLLPNGIDHLHYVLQTITNYNVPHASSVEIEGAYAKRADALAGAKECLVDGSTRKEDFVQYDERADIGIPQDWPFGEDVIIHAIATTGENYRVSLEKPLQTYERHRERKAQALAQCNAPEGVA
jgi:hypothetical protein